MIRWTCRGETRTLSPIYICPMDMLLIANFASPVSSICTSTLPIPLATSAGERIVTYVAQANMTAWERKFASSLLLVLKKVAQSSSLCHRIVVFVCRRWKLSSEPLMDSLVVEATSSRQSCRRSGGDDAAKVPLLLPIVHPSLRSRLGAGRKHSRKRGSYDHVLGSLWAAYR